MNREPIKIDIQEVGQYLLLHEEELVKMPQLLKTFKLLGFPLINEMTLGELVAFFRLKNKLTLRELGEKINKDFKYIDGIEKGKTKKPGNDTLALFIGFFGPTFREALKEIGINANT